TSAAGLRAQRRPRQAVRPRRPNLGNLLPGPARPAAWRPRLRRPSSRPHRLGQHAFQAVVLDAYHRSCAITGTKIRPVLQAAHVRPLTAGGQHRLDNGLLLRSDVHTLFDRGYLAVDTRYRLQVSPRLRSEFGNGEQFYARA